MPVGTLHPPMDALADSPLQPSGLGPQLLFEEARRRRRRRRVVGGVVACVALALALSLVLVLDGTGTGGGGPLQPSHGHGPPGGQAGGRSSSTTPGHRVAGPLGTPLCGPQETAPAVGNAKGTATLLPCYKVTLPSGVRTTTP
jgi:hypothetical protein